MSRINRISRGFMLSAPGKKPSKSKKKKSKKKTKVSLEYLKSLDWDELRKVADKFGVKFRSYEEAYREIMKAQ